MKSLEDYIIENLEKHINIDYSLFENAGLYDGIEELALFLTNKIRSHQEKEFKLVYKDTDREISKFKNIFFKSIILNCERYNGVDNEGEYELNKEIDYDEIANKFNFITINLELSVKHNQRETYYNLLHELTHAWDNFKSMPRSKRSKLSNSFKTSNYKEIINGLDSNVDYKLMTAQLLYYTNPAEVNAFIASFGSYLYDTLEDNYISDPHKALQLIKDSELYQNYINKGEFIYAMYNDEIDKNLIIDICREYNRINNKNYTIFKVKKLLYNQYQKTMQRIESNIGKLCVRYVKNLIMIDKNPRSIKFESICSL